MNNVAWTIREIGEVRDVSDVRLVQLDDAMGTDKDALMTALIVQQGTAEVDALRQAIAENRRLVVELEKLHIKFMNIIAVNISGSGAITVYTYGARA
jgi:hypothetical protein